MTLFKDFFTVLAQENITEYNFKFYILNLFISLALSKTFYTL